MTIDELIKGTKSEKWFSKLGEFPSKQGRFVGIPDLTLWAAGLMLELLSSAEPYVPHDQEFIDRFTPMVWLDYLEEAEDGTGSDLKSTSKEAQLSPKWLAELRRLAESSLKGAQEHPLLVEGPHRFLVGAKRAAAYTIERAAG